MDFKVQKKTLELLYKLLEGTNGIIPFVSYYPQKEAFPGSEGRTELETCHTGNAGSIFNIS